MDEGEAACEVEWHPNGSDHHEAGEHENRWFVAYTLEVDMVSSKKQLRDLYRKRAENYDFTANLYYLMGFREWNYRKKAIESLELKPGDSVLEIGCGTGLNFPLIQEAIGSQGRIIGIDLTDSMLERAEQRIKENGWQNVELINSDAAAAEIPAGIDKALSTFAITLIPEYDAIIKNMSRALSNGGRMAILDFKKPLNMPLWVLKFAVFLTRPFGVHLELADRHPWESVENYFETSWKKDIYWGFCYIAIGERPGKSDKSERINESDVETLKGKETT